MLTPFISKTAELPLIRALQAVDSFVCVAFQKRPLMGFGFFTLSAS